MSSERGFYHFGRYQIDIAQRVLFCGSEAVHLTPKAFDVLLLLVQHHGQVVDKNFLMQAVWPDVAVEDGNLTFNINVLRKSLGENGRDHQYIENVRGRGYKFIAIVSYQEQETSDPQGQNDPDSATKPNTQHLEDQSPRTNLLAPNPLLELARRYRSWLLGIGVAATVALSLNIAFVHPPYAQLLGDVATAALATISFYFYARATKKSARRDPAPTQAAAFRGLLPFESSDADRFYGRDIETAAIIDLICHSDFRFGVLYGDSGCGKTSLIRAALLPRLEAKGYLAIHCRSYKDPVEILTGECRKRSRVIPGRGESPLAYLQRVAQKAGSGLVVVCDQFEEFFVNSDTEQQRAPFVDLVAACNNATNLQVKFLFAIRSDFLYLIPTAFDEHIAETLLASRRYQLRHFDEGQALEVIERSVQNANWSFEPGLSRRIVSDLAVGGTILASELQIVGDQLQKKRIFTLERYRRVGGNEQLVHSYLEDVIKLAGDQQTASLVLRCLISEEDTRLTLPVVEINKRVQRSERVIKSILDLFVKSRLVREIQEEEPWRYELIHEYLIENINEATGKVMDATQRANRHFRQCLSNYAVDKRTRIPITQLWSIRRFSDMERGNRERELLRKSFWRGLLQTGFSMVLLAVVVILATAWLSLTEEWEGVRLTDGHTAGVRRAVFSPDGHLLVSTGEDRQVIVWDFIRRQKVASLKGHKDVVNGAAFSPDGKIFATSSYDQTVIIWDATTLKELRTLTGNKGRIGGLAFSPDGRLLASAADETILWETQHWEKSFEFPTQCYEHCAVLFSAESRVLTVRGVGWDLVARRKLPPAFEANWYGDGWAAFSPDSKQMISVNSGGHVMFVDMRYRRLLADYRAHQDNGRAVAFSPDGRLAATGAEKVVLWDAVARRKIISLNYPSIVWSLAFSPDGRSLVSTHGDGSILIWDSEERELVANLNEHSGPVRAVTYSRDGKLIASAGEDDSIIIWDAEKRQKEAVLIGHKNRVTGVAFYPDRRAVAATDQDGVTVSWELDQLRRGWSRSQDAPNYCLAVSPDGRWVATSHVVYAGSTGDKVVETGIDAWGVAFSPDSRWLIYPHRYSFVIWNTETWQVSYQSLVRPAPVTVNFSPDGKLFATGDDGGAVRLWQVNPFHEVAVLGLHSNRVKSVAFSPDGNQVASAGDDQTIKLWDIKRRRLVTTIGTHSVPVLSIAFSPDGKHLVSGEHDKSVHVYTRHRFLLGYQLD